MKCSVHTWLLILVLASVGSAQTVQNDARELWLVRAQDITSDLLKDGTDLSSMQRAVLWAKLAKYWWREDPKRARIWIANAIDVVEQVPNKETPDERRARLETAQTVYAIVIPLDQNLSKRLLAILGPDKSASDERDGAAFALMNAANAMVEEDPNRAAELGAQALRLGRPSNMDPLLYGLRASNPKLADSLFAQALVLAKQDRGGMFTNILTYIAFPEQRGRPGLPVPPEPLRIELLQILMTLVTANTANGTNENSNCGAVAWLAPLYGEVERLLPQQWPVLRQAINICQSVSTEIQQQIKLSITDQQANTVESLLKIAADTKELGPRTDYTYRAAALAQENREFERALKILDDMSDEQRQLMDESWTSARWDWAADGAVEHYRKGRFREMNLILDTVPSDLQPLAKAAFLDRAPDKKISETSPIVQILNDAIKGLRRSGIPEPDKSDWYLALLKPTVKFQPVDANSVLKDAVTALNKVKEPLPLELFDIFSNVGPPLVEMDEFVVKDALASVTNVQTRALLRLSLLKSTLQRVKRN